jgi:uncharacterized protein (DUF488 family)
MKAGIEKTLRIFTVGHSNLSFEQFVSLLKEHEIGLVADIRRYPSSRKFPHFNRPVLCELLAAENVNYLWLEALGGHRHAIKDNESVNIGLESIGFRNYADYMATDEFRRTINELLTAAAKSLTAIMCAEKLYWKCHRRLLSDYLTSRHVKVIHILDTGGISEHELTPNAVITETGVVYPSMKSTDHQRTLFNLDPWLIWNSTGH